MRSPEGRFREELGLNGVSHSLPGALVAGAREAGFDRAAFVDPSRLAEWAALWPARTSAIEADWVLAPQEWSRRYSILVCCLSCFRSETDDLSTPGEPHGQVAPFARAHYYRRAADLLRALAVRVERDYGFPRRALRIFSNSRMPEKQLLAATGLASVGKNGLCIVPGLGTMFVISGIVLPVPTEAMLASGASPAGEGAAGDPCGTCNRCLQACPMGALTRPGVLDRELCLQAWATRAEPFPSQVIETWGTRLYGCQECQSCCPHNARLAEAAAGAPGELGPSLPLLPFLTKDESWLKERLRGTALGMSWIAPSCLTRNALAAAGARRDPALRAAVAGHVDSMDPALRAAARWALERFPWTFRGTPWS